MSLEIKNISKTFDNNVQALKDVSFLANDNELLVVLGTSGSGKTTLLRILAGLEENYSGDVIIDNKNARDIELKDRSVAMVFQSYALYPQLSVIQNLELPLRQKVFYRPLLDKKGNQVLGVNKDKINEVKSQIVELAKSDKQKKKELKSELKILKKTKDTPLFTYQRLNQDEINKRVEDVVELLEISSFIKQKTSTLSGGQKQRVALAKAMLKEPKILLLDEPLSNLDVKLKKNARELIYKVHQKCGCITILVSHDQNDAYTLADRVVILKDGEIEQVGTNEEVLTKPNNTFVSQFFGVPPMNLIECSITNNRLITQSGESLTLNEEQKAKVQNLEKVIIGFRGDNISITDEGIFTATVIRSELVGLSYVVHANLFGQEITFKSDKKYKESEKLGLNLNSDSFILFDVDTQKRL
ncbi:MAG: ABC transporter ATP-binding protein [Bacilli bacterium]|nr:ABC transporter ATP-binding protein [Bacilli bacterium]